jgi:hypothetical protein
MPKTRISVPQPIREQVLKEFNHRCAVGGEERPQLHHIDENPSNNDPLNLIPLCPNCHLSNQHDPTRAIESGKLRLLRLYRDPTVLKPQFHPLFARLQFLESDRLGDYRNAKKEADDLVAFVAELKMGTFYARKIKALVAKPKYARIRTFAPGEQEIYRQEDEKHGQEYLEQLEGNKDEVYGLIMELLRFQNWN